MSPPGIVARSPPNHSTGLCGAQGLASQMPFSSSLYSTGIILASHVSQPLSFPTSCCYRIPGEVDGLALETPVDPTFQLVSQKCWLALARGASPAGAQRTSSPTSGIEQGTQ